MTLVQSNTNLVEKDENLPLLKLVIPYLYNWKYFVASLILCLSIAYINLSYSPNIYSSTAKVMIVDKKQTALELPSAAELFSSSKINLENEIEVFLSYPILEKVVRNLDLCLSIFEVGDIMNIHTLDYPFDILHNISFDEMRELKYEIHYEDNGIKIVDLNFDDEREFIFEDYTTLGVKHNLPFNITNVDKKRWKEHSNYFTVNFISPDDMVHQLKLSILTNILGAKSEIISLTHNSTNSKYSRNILNELISVFNNDGVQDRQLIHKRTIDFVNDRYSNLSVELDSIESMKQLYKVSNDLIDIEVNAANSLLLTSRSQEKVFLQENQISITKLLITTLEDENLDLLPSNIGLKELQINSLISDYNKVVLEKKNIQRSAGVNNPSIMSLDNILVEKRHNILFSLKNSLKQLENTREALYAQYEEYDNQISNLPSNEKVLRSIERNQQIKEALYLLLLQKREEAQVSYAVTEPSIKVVEYAISSNNPISPKANIVYFTAILFGLLIPFVILYLIFLFDNKIHHRDDVDFDLLGGSLIGEIPFLEEKEDGVNEIFHNPSDRSILAESFRMLVSNLKYILPEKEDSQVIISTSTIKSEGKTFNAINLSLSLASFDKKVLLIGADLRNPQLHKYLKKEKDLLGLSNYLVDNKCNWRKSLITHFDNFLTHQILLSGPLPPNPLQLLDNGNLGLLIEDAKKEYDYIILDTAPTLLVPDTSTISHHADAIVYVLRTNLTEKDLLDFPKELISSGKIKNVGFVLNGVGHQNRYGYQYGYKYGYGYGYKYKYSYNYGYGYGYEEDN